MKDISVLMVIYKNDKYEYLEDALLSIANQTLKAKEVILVINGFIEKFKLNSIKNNFSKNLNLRIFILQKNYGLAYALNFGLKKCKNDLVARMDPDDISLPHRFQIQYEFMNKHPYLAASSAWIEEFTEDMKISKGIRTTPIEDINIKNKYAKLRSPLNHIPSIIRKSIILKIGGYPNFKKGQDYALWALILVNGYTLKNIPEVLAKVRSSSKKTDRRGILRLYSEIPLIFFLYKISFLNLSQFIFSLSIRVIMRLIPYHLRKIIFKMLRAKAEELKNINKI